MPSEPQDPKSRGASDASGEVERWRRLHLWQFQGLRDLVLIAAIVALVWLGYALRSVTVPLLIGLLLAYLFEPIVALAERRRWCSRPIAAASLLAVAGLAVTAVLALAVPIAVGQAASLIESVRSGRMDQRFASLVERLPEEYRDDLRKGARKIFGGSLGAGSEPVAASADAGVEAPADDAATLAASAAAETPAAPGAGWSWWGVAGSGLRTIWSTILGVLEVMLAVVLIPFYFYYFSVSLPGIVKGAAEMVPQQIRPRVAELAGKMDAAVAGFVRGRIVISVLMGIGFAIGWLLVGVPYAILLGLLTGVFCAVPYLGVVGLPVAVGLLALEQAGLPEEARMAWWAILLWPSVVFAVVQLVESYLLTPVIAGKATDLSPLAIFVAVLAGGALAGIYGMLLSIPVAACIRILIVEVLLPRIRRWTRGEASDPLPVEIEA